MGRALLILMRAARRALTGSALLALTGSGRRPLTRCALLILTRAALRALTGCSLLALTGSSVWTLAGSALAETFTGQVIGVTDGDTISVLRAGRREVVRLLGIDAPERRQAYGERAKQHAAALAFGKVVAVEAAGRDRHGRLLAEVRLPDGRSLNQELVRAGFAWWFRRYSTDATLGRLEAEARGARRGLWSDPAPVPPWEHRRGRRSPSRPHVSRAAIPLPLACRIWVSHPHESRRSHKIYGHKIVECNPIAAVDRLRERADYALVRLDVVCHGRRFNMPAGSLRATVPAAARLEVVR
jgi:micrococcal nuclease